MDFKDCYGNGLYYIDDLSPKTWRRAYVVALFKEDMRWSTMIGKDQMFVTETAIMKLLGVEHKKEMDYLVNQRKYPAVKVKGSKRYYHTIR